MSTPASKTARELDALAKKIADSSSTPEFGRTHHHQHPLKVVYDPYIKLVVDPVAGIHCDGCGQTYHGAYHCDECSFDCCLACFNNAVSTPAKFSPNVILFKCTSKGCSITNQCYICLTLQMALTEQHPHRLVAKSGLTQCSLCARIVDKTQECAACDYRECSYCFQVSASVAQQGTNPHKCVLSSTTHSTSMQCSLCKSGGLKASLACSTCPNNYRECFSCFKTSGSRTSDDQDKALAGLVDLRDAAFSAANIKLPRWDDKYDILGKRPSAVKIKQERATAMLKQAEELATRATLRAAEIESQRLALAAQAETERMRLELEKMKAERALEEEKRAQEEIKAKIAKEAEDRKRKEEEERVRREKEKAEAKERRKVERERQRKRDDEVVGVLHAAGLVMILKRFRTMIPEHSTRGDMLVLYSEDKDKTSYVTRIFRPITYETHKKIENGAKPEECGHAEAYARERHALEVLTDKYIYTTGFSGDSDDNSNSSNDKNKTEEKAKDGDTGKMQVKEMDKTTKKTVSNLPSSLQPYQVLGLAASTVLDTLTVRAIDDTWAKEGLAMLKEQRKANSNNGEGDDDDEDDDVDAVFPVLVTHLGRSGLRDWCHQHYTMMINDKIARIQMRTDLVNLTRFMLDGVRYIHANDLTWSSCTPDNFVTQDGAFQNPRVTNFVFSTPFDTQFIYPLIQTYLPPECFILTSTPTSPVSTTSFGGDDDDDDNDDDNKSNDDNAKPYTNNTNLKASPAIDAWSFGVTLLSLFSPRAHFIISSAEDGDVDPSLSLATSASTIKKSESESKKATPESPSSPSSPTSKGNRRPSLSVSRTRSSLILPSTSGKSPAEVVLITLSDKEVRRELAALSKQCVTLIESLLNTDPSKRPSLASLVDHPFFVVDQSQIAEEIKLAKTVTPIESMTRILEELTHVFNSTDLPRLQLWLKVSRYSLFSDDYRVIFGCDGLWALPKIGADPSHYRLPVSRSEVGILVSLNKETFNAINVGMLATTKTFHHALKIGNDSKLDEYGNIDYTSNDSARGNVDLTKLVSDSTRYKLLEFIEPQFFNGGRYLDGIESRLKELAKKSTHQVSVATVQTLGHLVRTQFGEMRKLLYATKKTGESDKGGYWDGEKNTCGLEKLWFVKDKCVVWMCKERAANALEHYADQFVVYANQDLNPFK